MSAPARRLPVLADYAPPMRARTSLPRAATISMARYSKRRLEADAALYPERPGVDYQRPRTWGECVDAGYGTDGSPCPFVSCKHHLYLDVNEATGSIKITFPGLEVDELTETCALRVAMRGGVSLEEVGALRNQTRERARQRETAALRRIAEHPTTASWSDGAEALARPNAAGRGAMRDDDDVVMDLDLSASRTIDDLDGDLFPACGGES